MNITITIRALNNETIKTSLTYLSKQSIHDNLEVVVIDECYDDITDTVSLFEDKFDRITIKSHVDSQVYDSIIAHARGEYILFTTSNDLSAEKSYQDKKFLERLYRKASKNSCDVTFFNKINYHDNKTLHDYRFIDSILEKPFKYEDISHDELIALATLDCDVLYFNNFKLNPTRFFNTSLENPEEFLLENILNSNKILILKNYSSHRKYFRTLKTNVDKKDKLDDVDLERIYEDTRSLNIKDIPDVQEVLSQDFNAKISIIIPLYNPHTNDIIRILNPLFRQSFGFNNLKVIFINDASTYTDGIELIRSFSDTYPNIHLLEMSEHSGYGSSCNLGLDNATSEYVMFLDFQKTYYVDNTLETLYNIITCEDADIVGGSYAERSLSGNRVNWRKYGLTEYQTTITTNDTRGIALDIPTLIESKIYKKSFLDENSIRMKDIHFDAKMIFDYETILQSSSIVYVNETVTVCEKQENPYDDLNLGKPSLEKLLTIYENRYDLYNLCQETIPKTSYTVLNNLNYVTSTVLFKTPLNYEETNEVVDYSYDLYNKYLSNKKVKREKRTEKIAKYVNQKNYSATNNVYKRFIRMSKQDFKDYIYGNN